MPAYSAYVGIALRENVDHTIPTSKCNNMLGDYNRTYTLLFNDSSQPIFRAAYEYYVFELVAKNSIGNHTDTLRINVYDRSECQFVCFGFRIYPLNAFVLFCRSSTGSGGESVEHLRAPAFGHIDLGHFVEAPKLGEK